MNMNSMPIHSLLFGVQDTLSFSPDQLFLEKLDNLIAKGCSLERKIDVYTPLQRAVILGQYSECEHFCLTDAAQVSDRGKSDICTVKLAILAKECKISLLLFSFAAFEDRVNALYTSCIFSELSYENKPLFDFFWEKASEDEQIFLINYFAQRDLQQAHGLFKQVSPDVQRKFLAEALLKKQHDTFSVFWPISLPEAKAFADERTSFFEYAVLCQMPKSAVLIFKEAATNEQIKALRLSFSIDAAVFILCWNQAGVEAKNYIDADGYTWMHLAIILKKENLISDLVDHQFDMHIFDHNGKTSYELAVSRYSNQLSPSTLEKLRQADAGFTSDLVIIKLFGHHFSLEGPLFEGLPRRQVPVMIQSMIHNLENLSRFNPEGSFSPLHTSQFTKGLHLSDSSNIEKLAKKSQKKGALIKCGWKGHTVACLFFNDLCVKIDTGTASNPGLKFYRMGKWDQETLKFAMATLIQNSQDYVDEKQGTDYFEKTFNEQLNLDLIAILPESQEVGTCAFSALRASMLALLILQDIRQKALKGPIKKTALQESYDAVYSDFVIWDTWDCQSSLMQAIPLIDKYPKLFDRNQVLSKVLEKSFERGMEAVIIEILKIEPSLKNWQHPLNNQSLMSYAHIMRFTNLETTLAQLS